MDKLLDAFEKLAQEHGLFDKYEYIACQKLIGEIFDKLIVSVENGTVITSSILQAFERKEYVLLENAYMEEAYNPPSIFAKWDTIPLDKVVPFKRPL